MNRLRKILFWLFATGYVIVCPAVILFALGHVKAGLISLDVSPPEAEVYIAGRTLKQPWPKTISRLPSGTYQALVHAPGYGELVCEVSVTRGDATVLDHLLLLPDPPEPRVIIADTTFSDLEALGGTTHLMLTKENAPTLLAFDWKKGEARPVLPADSEPASASVNRIDTFDGSESALVWFRQKKKFVGVVIDLGNEPATVRTTLPVAGSRPPQVFWDGSNPEAFFLVANGLVRRAFHESKGTIADDSPLIGSAPWRGFGVGKGELYGLDSDCQLHRMNLDGKLKNTDEPEPKSEEIEKARLLFGDKEFFEIVAVDKKTFFFLGQDGNFLQNELPHQLAGENSNIIGAELIQQSGRALVWQSDKAGVIEKPAPARRREGQLEPGREVRWFYDKGAEISAVHLVYDGSHALVLDRDRVLLFELFPGMVTGEREVVRVKPGTSIAYVEEVGTLFFLDAKRGQLNALQLLPKSEVKIPVAEVPAIQKTP